MQIRPLLTLLSFALAAGGCSMFGSKADKEVVKLREVLEVPPDLARPAGEDFSASVPAERGRAPAADSRPLAVPGGPASVEPAAAAAATAATDARVRLERDGALRWLVVQDDPAGTWLRVRDYYLRAGMTLVADDPATGVLETDWIVRPYRAESVIGSLFAWAHSTGIKDKYRVRVERGRASGTTEVYVSHQGLEEVVAGGGGVQVIQTVWQPRPADPQAEAEMLAKISVQLGMDEQQARAMSALPTAERAQLTKTGLFLPQEDRDSAWRRVGQAFDRAGVAIEDLDRAAGIYYVRYQARAAKKSGGLFGWVGREKSVDVGDGARDRFQVVLSGAATGTTIEVRNVAGEPDTSEAGMALLSVLQQQLR